MDRVDIQAQDSSGMWRTYHTTTLTGNSQRILQEMKSLQDRYPNYRVRAVDQNGRIVDIL